MFQGTYHGKTAHESDLQDVIQRAVDVGCTKLMITGSDLAASKEAVELARRYRTSSTLLLEGSLDMYSRRD